MIKRLSWDSDFFNLEVGELHSAKIDDSLGLLKYDLIYVTSSDDFDSKLSGFKSSFSEEKVKFYKELKSDAEQAEHIFSHRDIKYDVKDIYELAYESGKQSRFLLDKRFASGKFEEMYQRWIDNSINGDFATDVLLYKSDEKIEGLLTYKVNEKSAYVGLISVSPNQQGKGIGRKMLQHLERILYQNGIQSLNIPTQNSNTQAISFYVKQGYKIIDRTIIKHYWKSNDTI